MAVFLVFLFLGSIEEQILKMQERKRQIAEVSLGNAGIEQLQRLSFADLQVTNKILS